MGFFTEPGMAWLIAGVVLVILEVVAPGMYLLWLGLAALGTGLIRRVLELSFGAQVAVFGALALISVLFALSRTRLRVHREINRPESGLVGRHATALSFDGTEGRVRLGDSDWPARLVGADSVAPGAHLLVEGVDGLVLLVRPSHTP
jgi:membrane protein implicated in regulation of membrane protease activity